MQRSSGLHHFGTTTQDLASWVVIGIKRHFKLIYSMFDGTFFCFNSLSHKVLPNNPSPLGSRVSHKTERGARGFTVSKICKRFMVLSNHRWYFWKYSRFAEIFVEYNIQNKSYFMVYLRKNEMNSPSLFDRYVESSEGLNWQKFTSLKF